MNEPIISPWIFYFLGVLENVNTILGGCFVLIVIGLIAIMFLSFLGGGWIFKGCLCKLRGLGIAVAIILVLCIFVPTRKTVIQMLIAQEATRANVDKAGAYTEKVIERIAEKVIEASEQWEKSRGK